MSALASFLILILNSILLANRDELTTLAMEDGDLTGTCWRDEQWFYRYGSLRRENVLQYFSSSPFHAALVNSGQVSASQSYVASAFACVLLSLSALNSTFTMTLQCRGGPFKPSLSVVDAQDPHLYIIRSTTGDAQQPNAFFYVLDGTVYQAPAALKVLHTRLVSYEIV